MNIGFIGLGVMGRPMAGHLIDAGLRRVPEQTGHFPRLRARGNGERDDDGKRTSKQSTHGITRSDPGVMCSCGVRRRGERPHLTVFSGRTTI